jgi:hypothetical protein
MFINQTAHRGTKRRNKDDSINNRPIKKVKTTHPNVSETFVADFTGALDYNPDVPMNMGNSTAFIVDTTIKSTLPAVKLALEAATHAEELQVRRSGRTRKPVNYDEGSSEVTRASRKSSQLAPKLISKSSFEAATNSSSKARLKTASKTTNNTPKVISKKDSNSIADSSVINASGTKGKELAATFQVFPSKATQMMEEHTRQEAVLALLWLANSYSVREFPVSSMRESLHQAVDNDVFTAALILKKLKRQAQNIERAEEEPKTIAKRMRSRTTSIRIHMKKEKADTEAKVSAPGPKKATSNMRRSTRLNASTLTDLPVSSPQRSSSPSKPLDLNAGNVLVPSASDNFKSKYDSPSGRTAAELDALLKPPVRPAKWPLDTASGHKIQMSYNQLGTVPKKGVAKELIRQMEKKHAK